MATNITFNGTRNLPFTPKLAAKPDSSDRPKLQERIMSALRVLAQPTQLTPTARAFHYSFRALPVPHSRE